MVGGSDDELGGGVSLSRILLGLVGVDELASLLPSQHALAGIGGDLVNRKLVLIGGRKLVLIGGSEGVFFDGFVFLHGFRLWLRWF